MPVQLARRLINVDEYHQMSEIGILSEKGIELIHGEILEMSPTGTKHSACINRLNALLSKLIREKAVISVQNPLQIDDFSEPEPDVAVLKYRQDFYELQHPQPADTLLIVEVADSSVDYDREVKLPIYAAAGIPEFWLVDLNMRQIEAYEKPTNDLYKIKEIFRVEEDIKISALDLNISVKDTLG